MLLLVLLLLLFRSRLALARLDWFAWLLLRFWYLGPLKFLKSSWPDISPLTCLPHVYLFMTLATPQILFPAPDLPQGKRMSCQQAPQACPPFQPQYQHP